MVFDGLVLHLSMGFDDRSWLSMVNHQIPCSPWSYMVTISPGFFFHVYSETQLTQTPSWALIACLALSFIQFRFLTLYRSSLQDLGTVNGTQTGISKHSCYSTTSKIQEKLTTTSSLNLHRAVGFSIPFHIVSYCSAIKSKILIT